MSASEKRTHPKKTRFPPRAKAATRTSRRGRVDGLSAFARTIFCTSPVVEKKTQKRITFCGTEGERKRDRRPRRKRRTSLLGPHVVAARCTSFLNGFNDARAYSRRRCRRRRRRRLFSISKTDSGLSLRRHSRRRAGRRVEN